MSRLLRADFYRMYHNRRFWLCAGSMVTVALLFIIMQYTAMDYTVPFSRVIFLPMTFYGIATAALISFFIGDDFSDGVIRNKVVAGRSRHSIYHSNLMVSWSACLTIYLLTVTATAAMGINFFDNDVPLPEYGKFLFLGLFSCLAFGSIFCMLSMLIAGRSASVMACLSLAFVMLFLCLHTNQMIVQQPYKGGVLNPHYVGGAKRIFYELLHDINPFGQIAQLSSMQDLNPVRWIFLDILWMIISAGLGNVMFLKKDIK